MVTFKVMDKVDSMDWLIKIAPCDPINGITDLVENKVLWNIGEWGTLKFVEVYKESTCVARFMYYNEVVYCVVVYPPYRNQGILKEILKWLETNTDVVELTTTNPIMKKTVQNFGYSFVGLVPGGVNSEKINEPVEKYRKK